jgi:hypothetical protein
MPSSFSSLAFDPSHLRPAPIPPPLPSNLSASEKGKEREDPVKNERSDSLDMTDGVVDLRVSPSFDSRQSQLDDP